MQGQEKWGKLRLLGYAIGIVAVIAVVTWRLIFR